MEDMSGRRIVCRSSREESWHDATSGPGSLAGHSTEGTTSSFLTAVEPDRDSYPGEDTIDCIMNLQETRSAPRPIQGTSSERVADANSAQVTGQREGCTTTDNELNATCMMMNYCNSETEACERSNPHQLLKQSLTSDSPDYAPSSPSSASEASHQPHHAGSSDPNSPAKTPSSGGIDSPSKEPNSNGAANPDTADSRSHVDSPCKEPSPSGTGSPNNASSSSGAGSFSKASSSSGTDSPENGHGSHIAGSREEKPAPSGAGVPDKELIPCGAATPDKAPSSSGTGSFGVGPSICTRNCPNKAASSSCAGSPEDGLSSSSADDPDTAPIGSGTGVLDNTHAPSHTASAAGSTDKGARGNGANSPVKEPSRPSRSGTSSSEKATSSCGAGSTHKVPSPRCTDSPHKKPLPDGTLSHDNTLSNSGTGSSDKATPSSTEIPDRLVSSNGADSTDKESTPSGTSSPIRASSSGQSSSPGPGKVPFSRGPDSPDNGPSIHGTPDERPAPSGTGGRDRESIPNGTIIPDKVNSSNGADSPGNGPSSCSAASPNRTPIDTGTGVIDHAPAPSSTSSPDAAPSTSVPVNPPKECACSGTGSPNRACDSSDAGKPHESASPKGADSPNSRPNSCSAGSPDEQSKPSGAGGPEMKSISNGNVSPDKARSSSGAGNPEDGPSSSCADCSDQAPVNSHTGLLDNQRSPSSSEGPSKAHVLRGAGIHDKVSSRSSSVNPCDEQTSSSSGSPEKASATLFTATMLGDPSFAQPSTVSDERGTPGICLASPQASPFQQLCSNMQQVAVDQHYPDRERSDGSQKFNSLLRQEANRGLAVAGALQHVLPEPATPDTACAAVDNKCPSSSDQEQRTPLISSTQSAHKDLSAHQSDACYPPADGLTSSHNGTDDQLELTGSNPREAIAASAQESCTLSEQRSDDLDDAHMSIAQDTPATHRPSTAAQPSQSLALSGGCISDMSSMMEPCRGASPRQEASAHDAPALLIAQCNPLYNESQDPEMVLIDDTENCESPSRRDTAAAVSIEASTTRDKHSNSLGVMNVEESEPTISTSPPQISAAPTDLHGTNTSRSVDSVLNKVLSSKDASYSVKERESSSHAVFDDFQASKLQDIVPQEGQVPASVAAACLADVFPSVLTAHEQQGNAETFAESHPDAFASSGLNNGMSFESRSPFICASRPADVCPVPLASPGEAGDVKSRTGAPSDPSHTFEHQILPGSVLERPNDHLLDPEILPAQKHPIHSEAIHTFMQPIENQWSTDPPENQAPKAPKSQDDVPQCSQNSRGLERQRSLLCTALAATRLRNDTQVNHTDAEDPLAPTALPSAGSTQLRPKLSMDDKQSAMARTSTQSDFTISAVHKNDEHGVETSHAKHQSDFNSAELSVCCTPRVPTHLGTPRTGIEATTQHIGGEETQKNVEVHLSSSDINPCKSDPISSFGQPENADSGDIPVPGNIWEEAAKFQRAQRTRTMLRKRADSGIAAVLRKNTPGGVSRSISDGCAAFIHADSQGCRDQNLHSPEVRAQQICSDLMSAYQDAPLNMASSLSEGLAKDVVITQSVQLKDASERGANDRTNVLSPSSPAPFQTPPNTCPAALPGTDEFAAGIRPPAGHNWPPLFGTSPLFNRTPSPTTKHRFAPPANFPRTSPSNKWRRAADIASRVPKGKNMGWKDLFKRLASGNVSPAPLRATTCSSASLTIKPVLATPTSDDQNILQRLEMSPDKVAQARSVAEQAISSIDSLLEERKRRQTHDNELRSYESMPAVSRPNASPLHGGVPYMSPSSVDASAAICASAGTSRSCTPSQLGSLEHVKEHSAASNPDTQRNSQHKSDREEDVQASLHAKWAKSLSAVDKRVDSTQDIMTCEVNSCTSQLSGIEVEEIELGPSDSEDLLLPMAPLSTADQRTRKSFRREDSGTEGKSASQSVDSFAKSGQASPHGQPHDCRAVFGNMIRNQTVNSFGCGQTRRSTSATKSP